MDPPIIDAKTSQSFYDPVHHERWPAQIYVCVSQHATCVLLDSLFRNISARRLPTLVSLGEHVDNFYMLRQAGKLVALERAVKRECDQYNVLQHERTTRSTGLPHSGDEAAIHSSAAPACSCMPMLTDSLLEPLASTGALSACAIGQLLRRTGWPALRVQP